MQRRTWRVAFTTVALGIVAGASALGPVGAAVAAPSDGPARVYVSLPRQGLAAPSAALIARGLRTALAERDGVAGGRKVRIVWMDGAKDDRWNRKRVVANARRAAADPSAVAYVGEGNSEATAITMPIVNRAGLVHLSPVSTAATLTDARTARRYQPTGIQTFFRPMPGDARQSAALLSAVRRAGLRKRVVVIDDGGIYGRGLTDGFRAGAARARVDVVGRYVADRRGRALAALAKRVAAKRPTAVVYAGPPSSNAAAVLRALHRAAPRVALFGGDALAHDSFVEQLGDAQARVRLTTPAAHVDPRRKAGRGLGERPDAFAVFAYNGMEALLAAIDRAAKGGDVTRASVRDAVFDGTVQRGLSGEWKITERGDSLYGVYDLLRAANGRTVTPVDRLADKLVRRARAKDRKAKARSATPAPGRGAMARATFPVPRLGATTLSAGDLESALLLVQQERTRLLDDQLEQQVAQVQARNDRIAKLNHVLSGLNRVLARIPETRGDARLDASGPPESYAAEVATLRAALRAADVTLELMDAPGSWTRAVIEAAITSLEGMIDAQSNAQQTDMLRLQALANKRNEAFHAMASFIKKLQDNSDVIGNIR